MKCSKFSIITAILLLSTFLLACKGEKTDNKSDEEQEIVIRRVRKNKKESVKPSSPINIPNKEPEINLEPVEEKIEPIAEDRKFSHREILRAMGM